MAKSVDQINITNIATTGSGSAIRVSMNLELWWTDDAGEKHHHTDKAKWPQDLDAVPADVLKRWAAEQVIQAARWRLGIDPV